MEEKKKLLVSVSGGETSMFMAQWLNLKMKSEYEMLFVFANTGRENEETLDFINKCSKHFKINITWVEAAVVYGKRVGTMHKVVDYATASRDGRPFEDVIKKYGIPNQAYPHCTRELKLNPIKSFMKSIGWENYYTAIGIRADEIDRMAKNRVKNKIIYPLITNNPRTKKQINAFWHLMPFRLDLKGYQGNCKTCWKKSDRKLYALYNENPNQFKWDEKMEQKYSYYTPKSRTYKSKPPYRFFRNNRSVNDIKISAKNFTVNVQDDSVDYDYNHPDFEEIGAESCEIYASCESEENSL